MPVLFNVAKMGLESFSPKFGKLVRTVGGEEGTKIYEQFVGKDRVLTCVDKEGTAIRRRVTGKSRVPVDGSKPDTTHTYLVKSDYYLNDGSNRMFSKDLNSGTVRISRNNGQGEIESLTLSQPFESGRTGNIMYKNGSYSLHNYNTNQHLNVSGNYWYQNIDAYGVKNGKKVDYTLTEDFSIPKGSFEIAKSKDGKVDVWTAYDTRNVKKEPEKNYIDSIGQYFQKLLRNTGVHI